MIERPIDGWRTGGIVCDKYNLPKLQLLDDGV